jgi:hypothetical protein
MYARFGVPNGYKLVWGSFRAFGWVNGGVVGPAVKRKTRATI